MSDRSNNIRIALERAIVRKVIRELKTAGFVPVKVWDGGEYVPAESERAAIDAVFAVDDSTIHFATKDNPKAWGNLGVYIVLGNGEDCVSDYHCGNATFCAAIERVYEWLDRGAR